MAIISPDDIIGDILKNWDAETRWLRTELKRIRPRPRDEDIEDAIVCAGQCLIEKPPSLANRLHGRNWLRKKCRNLLRNVLRDAKKFQNIEAEGITVEAIMDDTEFEAFELVDMEQAALRLLDAEDAELLRLAISGLHANEIAKIMGVKRTTLAMRLKHMHTFLKENLK